MATNTYVALDKVTVGASTASITFSNINQGYTDLVIVADGVESANQYVGIRFNSDTASNYSQTRLFGEGTGATSDRQTSVTFGRLSVGDPTNRFSIIASIFNYANTTTYKTWISQTSTGNNYVGAIAGLWRATPAAITSITVTTTTSDTFSVGSTFSLYGIKAEPMLSTKATGGTITYGSDGYIYHVFTSSGTFAPNQSLSCQVLVVGGGGGGESFYSGVGWGSGGTGGYATYSSSSSFTAQNYTVTIGAGGAGGSGTSGANGSTGGTSSVNSITAAGGAGGTDGSGPGYGAGGTVSTYRSSPAGAIGVEYFGYKVAGGGWYGQNSQDIANYPVNSTQYGGGFQKGYTVASASTSPYYGGGGAGGSNSGEGGTNAGQSGASGLVIIRYLA
jgi:hypothetical protein